LAAPQVGVSRRLFVIDTTIPRHENLLVFVNPEIIERDGEITWEEGCLSFPDVHTEVQRSKRIVIRAQDAAGAPFEMEAEDLLAVAIQHELDHLDGRLLIDNMSFLDRAQLKLEMTRQAIEAIKPG
ncbi:MAG: peptide deformylase, partial [Deltaproteobacteria bacterium]|nr:peptide deformylase [Deltaproteobacteria bacterium]